MYFWGNAFRVCAKNCLCHLVGIAIGSLCRGASEVLVEQESVCPFDQRGPSSLEVIKRKSGICLEGANEASCAESPLVLKE